MNFTTTLRTLVQELYGIEVIDLTSMEGYDSTNFKVDTDQGTFVLKLYSNDAVTLALLEAENRILKSVGALEGLEFPLGIPALDGTEMPIDGPHAYRLLRFLEGTFLADVRHTAPLLRSLGTFLAHMDQKLMEFHETAIGARQIPWDLQHFPSNHRLLTYIQNPTDRNLVDYFFLQYQEVVEPLRHELRKSIIHNDANDWNVLTRDGKVTGLIDFGDMCHSWLVNEVAVALTYVMFGKDRPLEIASEVLKGYHGVLPLTKMEIDILYYLVAARLCTSVCNSAFAKTEKPDSEYIVISEKPAWRLLRTWISLNPIHVKNVFRKALEFPPSPSPDMQTLLDRRKSLISRSLSLSYEKPIPMVRSAFQYMYDTEGNTFLDAYNNIMLVGHCHPKVVRAAQRTMARLNTNTRYVYEEMLTYAETLLSRFPNSLNKVFFVNSGSAATDLALRMAKSYTGSSGVVGLEHGYHGNTEGAIAVSHYKYAHKHGIGRQDHVRAVPMPKAFGSGRMDDGSAGSHFAEEALSMLEDLKSQPLTFIAEPVMGCGGQVPLAKGYLKTLYPFIRSRGGLCISDEVQVGFGRLGTSFWGYEMHGVIPDMVILGKPMGNGHPIGAVITNDAIAKAFESGPEFFSSFGGNPVSCAIGQAVLEVIQEEGLQEHARHVGSYLMEGLEELAQRHREMADVRGSGLFLGVELLMADNRPGTQLAAHVKNRLRGHHILIGTDGPENNVLKIKPPLSFSLKDCNRLIDSLDLALS